MNQEINNNEMINTETINTGMINTETINKEKSSMTAPWLSSLPEELRATESLSKFKDTTQLAQSYLEAEKALSARIAVPDEKADNEAWNKFYQRLGLPEDKRYTDKRSETDEQYLQSYEEMFYNSGLSKRQGEKLLGSLQDYSKKLECETLEQKKSEIEKMQSENIDWLKKNYGNDFESNMTSMQAALKEFGSRELAEMLEDSLYAPALIDMLSRVGRTLKSDSLITGNEKAPISSSEGALKEIKKLESDSDFMVQLRDKNHAGHGIAVSRMRELYDIAY